MQNSSSAHTFEPLSPDAVSWLRGQLAGGPRVLSDLIKTWVGPDVDHPAAKIDQLNEAMATLKVEVFSGPGEYFWWRLPQPVGHKKNWLHRCGQPLTIRGVTPSWDDAYLVTHWLCVTCKSVGCTPSTLQEPPSGWPVEPLVKDEEEKPLVMVRKAEHEEQEEAR